MQVLPNINMQVPFCESPGPTLRDHRTPCAKEADDSSTDNGVYVPEGRVEAGCPEVGEAVSSE